MKGAHEELAPERIKRMERLNEISERKEKNRAAWHAEYEAMTDDEREELRQRAAIDDTRVKKGMTPLEAFRKHALPPKRISRPVFPGAPVQPYADEVLIETWNELGRKSLGELMTLRDALRDVAERFERMVEDHFKAVERGVQGRGTDKEIARFVEWYREIIMHPHLDQWQDPYVPVLWSKIDPFFRHVHIRERQRVKRYEDTARAARFRLDICEQIITHIALVGAASTWTDTPEDERPVFEELHPYHMENRPWIVNKYWELREEHPNESASSVRKRVCEEYNLVFGDRFRPLEETTVRRYIGEKEPR